MVKNPGGCESECKCQVHGEHYDLLPDGSQDQGNCLSPKLCEGDISIEASKVNHWPPPYWHLLNNEKSTNILTRDSLLLLRLLSPTSCPILLEVPEPVETLSCRNRTLKVTTQVGDSGVGADSWSKGTTAVQASTLKASQTWQCYPRYLSPANVMKVRNVSKPLPNPSLTKSPRRGFGRSSLPCWRPQRRRKLQTQGWSNSGRSMWPLLSRSRWLGRSLLKEDSFFYSFNPEDLAQSLSCFQCKACWKQLHWTKNIFICDVARDLTLHSITPLQYRTAPNDWQVLAVIIMYKPPQGKAGDI